MPQHGAASLEFQADSSYHVLWKTSQRAWTVDDGPLKTATFDADSSLVYPDTGGDDYASQTVSTFGEWERLPVGGVYLQPGEYSAQLVSFTATPQAGAIQLEWETAAERDLLGSNLYRAGPGEGQRIPLNAGLIPSQAPGSLMGASYLFVDSSAVPKVTYTYWLEHLDLHGMAIRHGPASASLLGFRVFLPQVVR